MFRVQGRGVSFITQAPHGVITCGNPATDAGSRRGWGRTYHICGVLTQDYEVSGVPSAGMSGNCSQCRLDEESLHVQAFLIKVHGATGREEVAAPLQHVWNARVGGATA